MLKCHIWCNFILRRCCTLHSKLTSQNVVEKLSNNNEDVASFVRFNRAVEKLNPEKFADFYSSKANPHRSERELTEIKLKISLICCQYDYLCYRNMRVPSSLTNEDMEMLLRMNSPQRELYLVRAYFRDSIKILSKVKQFVKRELKGSEKPIFELGCFDADGQLQYGLWKNNMFIRAKRNERLMVQRGINATLWGHTLALDWTLPYPLSQSGRVISKRSVRQLVHSIYNLCNVNLKHHSLHQATFNMIHLGLSSTHFCYNDLAKMYNECAIDRIFWQRSDKSHLEIYPYRKMIYISAFASDTLQEDDITNVDNGNGAMFVVSPYTELYGLNRLEVQSMMQMKQSEPKDNVLHRRLPLHNMIDESLHLVLSHQIQCLRDVVINGKSWDEAVYKNLPNKYLKK